MRLWAVAVVLSCLWIATPVAADQMWTLKNNQGMEVTLTDYGARVMGIKVPDRAGKLADVALGYNDIESYRTAEKKPYFGPTVGRSANRIAQGQFSIDGVSYMLATNNGPNHNHGGVIGFDKVVWTGESLESENAIRFRYRSADGEEGYPGNVDASVTYAVTEANELMITYRATTDQPTVVNFSNHTYFNLAGEGSPTVLGHQLMVNADAITPTDETSVPTGEFLDVADTPFDFRQPRPIGTDIDADHPQIKNGSGYDHNFVLKSDKLEGSNVPLLAATLFDPNSGRLLEVLTTEPGIQVYTANFLNGTLVGKSGRPYQRRSAVCLETQHFPDAPNQPNFPNTILRPDEVYTSQTIFRFSTRP